jgi:hypothetical protein
MCGEYFVPDMVEKTVGSPTVAALSAGTLAQSYSSESWWPEVVEVLLTCLRPATRRPPARHVEYSSYARVYTHAAQISVETVSQG